MNLSPATRPASGALGPLGLLAGLTVAAWLAGALWPVLLVKLGLYDYGMLYLDSHAVLAALDAQRAGADPHAANPLDPLLRHHVYSDWWLALRWLGLTRAHNFLVGTAWVGAFAVTAWFTTRPRTWGEAAWMSALMISPPVLLAVNRANNDLLIFVVLAGCGLAATSERWVKPLLAVGCLALATGLKYYPAAAALAFLWTRPVRRMPVVLLAALGVAGLALASVWDDLERGRFALGPGVHVMGAPLLWRDLGWKDADSAVPGILLIVAGAVALTVSRFTTGLATRGEPRERVQAAVGAIVILACFASGVNFAYRWIFILWPAFWLWRQAASSQPADRQRRAARFGCALLGLCLWIDGCLCVIVNFLPPRDQAWVDHVQLVFRQWTQPLHWALMALLAGWLLEGALTIAREWRKPPSPGAQRDA